MQYQYQSKFPGPDVCCLVKYLVILLHHGKRKYIPQGSNWAQGQAPYLRAVAPGLVGGDHHIGGHEEGAILRRGHHIVCLVPHPVIELPDVGRQGHGEDVLQRRLGVTLDLSWDKF